MKTILNIPASSRTLRFPNGYRVMGTLQPLGEIAPGIFHLEIREDPPPGHDAATQYLRKLPGVQDGNAWRIAWEIVEIPPPEPPMAITPRQMRLALLARGITPATITGMLEGNEAARIEWEYSLEIRRDHPLVASMAAALGFQTAEVDAIFAAAADL